MNTVVKWTAHVLGIASFLFILPFLLGGEESMRPTWNEMIGLTFFPCGVLLGFAIAWWRERLGGIVTVASLILFYVWIFTRDGQIPTTPYFAILAIPGFLHLLNTTLLKSDARSTSLPLDPHSEPRG